LQFCYHAGRLRWIGVPRRSHRAWILALAGAATSAEVAYLLLRPRDGVVASLAAELDDHFQPADVNRARQFGRPQQRLSAANSAVQVATLICLIRRRGDGDSLRRLDPLDAAISGAALSLTLLATSLPIGAVMRQRTLTAGLGTQSWRGWGGDVLRSGALGAAFAGGGAAAVSVLSRRFGSRWWVAGAAGSVAIAAVAAFAGPVLLDPLFNDFAPLPPGALKNALLELGAKADVQIGDVLEVDASRRTTMVNAYVAGLGATRRVVLFDTLLSRFTPAETELVVAHELAHVRYRDVIRDLAYLALVAPAATRAVARLAEQIDGSTPLEDTTLPALTLAAGIVAVVIGVVGRQLSREIERRADSFSLELTDDPKSFISFEQSIAQSNLADPDPPRWASVLLATHPPTMERIGIALAYEAGARPTTRRPPRRPRTPAGS
jgi:STE24 endopeptidase